MNRFSTLLLRLSVCFVGTVVLAVSALILCWVVEAGPINPAYASLLYSVLTGMYSATLPFYYALYETMRLLTYIDRHEAFSEKSIGALHRIKYCGIIVCVLFTACLPTLYLWADSDDAPGILVIGLIVVFASFVVSLFAAVLERLLKEALAMKAENDLTV